jgi:hypothetical protein
MKRTFPVIIVVSLVAGCGGGDSPTAPNPVPLTVTSPSVPAPGPSPDDRTFSVSGVVRDDRGLPLVNVEVIMRHYLGGRLYAPSAHTDGSGGYRIAFTATPYRLGEERAAARAELMVDDFEWYFRDVVARSEQLVENFVLLRRKQMAAGDAIVLNLNDRNGLCLGWLYGPCARVRVLVPADGTLTIVATARSATDLAPSVQVCCVSGTEQYGNPITIPVVGLDRFVDIEVGQPGRGSTTSESVEVRTSYEQR